MDINTLQQLFKQAVKECDYANVLKFGEQLLALEETETLTHDTIRCDVAYGYLKKMTPQTSLTEMENYLVKIEGYFSMMKTQGTRIRHILASAYQDYASRLPKAKDTPAQITKIALRGLDIGLTKYDLKALQSVKLADKEYFSTWANEIEKSQEEERSKNNQRRVNDLAFGGTTEKQLSALKKVDESFAIERFKQFLTKKYAVEYPTAIAALTEDNVECEIKLAFNKTVNFAYTMSSSRYYLSYQTAAGWTRTGEIEFKPKQSYENSGAGSNSTINQLTANTDGEHIVYEDVTVISNSNNVPNSQKLKRPNRYDVERAAEELFQLKTRYMTGFKYQEMESADITYERSTEIFVPVYRIILRNGKYTVNGYINAVDTTRASVNILVEERNGSFIDLTQPTPATPPQKGNATQASKKSLIGAFFGLLVLFAQAIPYLFGGGLNSMAKLMFAGATHLSFIISIFVKNRTIRRILYVISIASALVGVLFFGGGAASGTVGSVFQYTSLL